MSWEPRTYRRAVQAHGLVSFEVVLAETDLQISAEANLVDQARSAVARVRSELDAYVVAHPRFAESFAPVPVEASAPAIVSAMAQAAALAGVGPMAAVAGAVAQAVAESLAPHSREVIVENGGDLYLIGDHDRVVAVWTASAGATPFGIEVPARLLPLAVATSSATIGPSVSLGGADTATVLAGSGALADAAASALGNRIRGPADIESGVAAVSAIPGVLGAVVTVGGAVGARGDVRLVPVERGP